MFVNPPVTLKPRRALNLQALNSPLTPRHPSSLQTLHLLSTFSPPLKSANAPQSPVALKPRRPLNLQALNRPLTPRHPLNLQTLHLLLHLLAAP